MEDIYKKATMKNLGFQTARGQLITSDLFSLPLTELDGLYKQIKAGMSNDEDGLIARRPELTDDALRLKIVKDVFETQQEIADKRKSAAATRAKNQRIMELIEEKQDGALAEKSVEELQALLNQDEE